MKKKSSNSFAEWRRGLGITQARAAELLGVSIRAIKHYEAGTRQPRESVVKLCHMVEVEWKRR